MKDTITLDRAVVEQALEALQRHYNGAPEDHTAIRELRAAIAAQQQEPDWKAIAAEHAQTIAKMAREKYPFVHIRMDASEAEKEDALRAKLIELGWTPPATQPKGPVLGTKTWMQDGVMFEKNLYASDLYPTTQPASEQNAEQVFREEMAAGAAAAKALVVHLESMGAGACRIPVAHNGHQFTVSVEQLPE